MPPRLSTFQAGVEDCPSYVPALTASSPLYTPSRRAALRPSGSRLSKKWLCRFFEKASLRSAPRLSADSGQFDAHSAQSVFRHAHVAAENELYCFRVCGRETLRGFFRQAEGECIRTLPYKLHMRSCCQPGRNSSGSTLCPFAVTAKCRCGCCPTSASALVPTAPMI